MSQRQNQTDDDNNVHRIDPTALGSFSVDLVEARKARLIGVDSEEEGIVHCASIVYRPLLNGRFSGMAYVRGKQVAPSDFPMPKTPL